MTRERLHEYEEEHREARVEGNLEGTPGKHTLTERLEESLIAQSVGVGGRNERRDVRAVQRALALQGHSPGPLDQIVGTRTIGAIRAFQATILVHPDGLIEVDRKTEQALRKTKRPRPKPRPQVQPIDSAVAPPAVAPVSDHSPTADRTQAGAERSGAQGGTNDKVLSAVERFQGFIDEAAARYGMSPRHIKAIMAVESKGDPNATSGAAFGLMQITRGTWEQTRKTHAELRGYGFDNWRDPRINILFGAAVLKSKANSMGVDSTDDSFAALAVTAYNAGEGTVKTAMALAKNAGSAAPKRDFLRPEFLKPAIAKHGLHSYYLTNEKGRKRNKSGTEEEAIDLKYREIIRYAPQVDGYLAKLGAGRPAAPARTPNVAPTSNARPKQDAPTAHALEESEAHSTRAGQDHEHPTYAQIAKNFHAAIPGSSFTWHEALWLPTWGKYARPSDATNESFDTILANIAKQAAALQRVRDHFGKKLVVHCWLRPPAYNARVKGAKNSSHLRGMATDFHLEGMSAEAVRKVLKAERIYPGAGENNVSWLHLDLEHVRWFNP